MNYIEYIFKDKSIIHALITKPSVNLKIGIRTLRQEQKVKELEYVLINA